MCYICRKSLFVMRKILFYYSLGATIALFVGVALLRRTLNEVERLENNQEVLSSEVKLYRTRYDESAASVQSLRFRLDEMRQLHERDVERIRDLGIKLRRVESLTTSMAATEVEVQTTRRDTVVVREVLGVMVRDSLSLFSWSDAWVNVEGEIRGEDVRCRVRSVDTLRQVVYRVPRRFLGIPYGVKALRQEIISSNPHTKIVYAEYIELQRRRGKKRNFLADIVVD